MTLNEIVGDGFRGNILVTVANDVVLNKSNGYADLSNEIPNSAQTKFATASAGKVFVAVGILQLVEKGLLKLEDKIKSFLDFDLNQIDPEISIRELLSHTSGIPDYFDESVMTEYGELWTDFPNYKVRTNKDLLPLFIDKPMMYHHGSKFQYNNTGYVVLAMIIEKVTKKLLMNTWEKKFSSPVT